MEARQQPIIGRLLRVREDIVASHPAKEDKAYQQEHEDRPTEKPVRGAASPAMSGVTVISVGMLSCHESLKKNHVHHCRQTKRGKPFLGVTLAGLLPGAQRKFRSHNSGPHSD